MVENPRLKLKSFDKRALIREVCARVQFTARTCRRLHLFIPLDRRGDAPFP